MVNSIAEYMHPPRDQQFQRDVVQYLERFEQSFMLLRQTIRILGLGIDYRKYVHFQDVTPAVRWDGGGWHCGDQGDRECTPAQLKFAIDFLVEAALQLQAFDFDVADTT